MAAVAWLLGCASAAIWPEARRKFNSVVIAWLSVLATATLAYNALWYPRTFFGAHYYDLMIVSAGPFHVGQLVYGAIALAASATLCAGGLLAMQRMQSVQRRRWTVGVATMAGLALAAIVAVNFSTAARAHAQPGKPNVIFLGIDSLRLDQLRRFDGQSGNTTHLDEFLDETQVFRDVSTPMARTFGSWVAILTGRSPVETGARNNLTPRDVVAANPTIADVLRANGYRTVYSTDEVRFANIDETYGFDQVITPPIGASDFILGTYNEFPLPSVVMNTRLGQYLFPYSYGNRGAAHVFEPQTYLARLDRELEFRQPTMLVVHLTAAHWPYYVADTPFGVAAQAKDPSDRPMYRVGLRTADSMFERVVSMLRRKGAFENSIVIVLSDHGEAMLLPNDAILQHGAFVSGLGAPLKVLDVGHGQSVLSPTQYKVLLGFRYFGPGKLIAPGPRDIPLGATVEDIAPTVLDLLGIPGDPLSASGQSLANYLRSAEPEAMPPGRERIRFTETDLSVLPNVQGEIDETATAKANSKFFAIDPVTARMYIRHDMLPVARAYKERAAFTSRRLLAALPAGPDAHQFVYFDLESGHGQLLLERPGPELDDGQRLWDALQSHYAGELRRPVCVTMADWPVIEYQWQHYFTRRAAREPQQPDSAAQRGADTGHDSGKGT
jgi:arylsulfatase A-like enzyme